MHKIKLVADSGKKHIDNMTKDELERAQNLALSMSFESRQVFLENLLKPTILSFSYKVTSPEWLESDFDGEVWICLFGKAKKTIDFRVNLEDGSLLTDASNAQLLYTFKCILCHQTHPRYNSGRRLAPKTCSQKVLLALHFFDYVLMRANYFRLSEFGLTLLTSNDLDLFINRVNAGVAEGVYDHLQNISQFLRKNVKLVTETEIKEAIKNKPEIQYLPKERYLDLTDDELIRAKTWMWNKDLYKSCGARYSLNRLKSGLYVNTLHGNSATFPKITDLLIGQASNRKEFPPVPVRSENDGICGQAISNYKALIRSLRSVSFEKYQGVCGNVLDEFDKKKVSSQLQVDNKINRYRSVPAGVVLKALRDAFEFTTLHADDIFEAIQSLFQKSYKYSGDTPALNMDRLAPEVISGPLSELGVTKWHIESGLNPDAYYKQLRVNVGLLELYKVLMGSIQVIIGVLMARRAGELIDLTHDCLSPKGKDPCSDKHQNVNFSISFDNRKSGDQGDRETLIRPITRSGAKLIWKLQKFRLRLIEIGIVSETSPLLQVIDKGGMSAAKPHPGYYYHHFDLFCDYFETMTIELSEGDERRYYLRQHQLRRFFAMSFFWGSGYDGLDTLRWFLGHTDAEHLWHYITENTPGLVLRGVKAETLVHGLNADNIVGIERLREMLKERFDVSALSIESLASVVDDFEDEAQSGYVKLNPALEALKQEVEGNLETLLKEGVIDLKPTFLTVTNEDSKIVQQVTLVLVVKEIEND